MSDPKRRRRRASSAQYLDVVVQNANDDAPVKFPDPGKLPRAYRDAQRALERCERIDECKRWHDHSAALASYARQVRDDDLGKLANRIRARATRRIGELLHKIAPAKGGRPPKTRAGTGTGISRAAAARAAGLSIRQRVVALRVASVPEIVFEQRVESPDPPTITELAEEGKADSPVINLGSATPKQYLPAMRVRRALRELRAACDGLLPDDVAEGIQSSDDVAAVRSDCDWISVWLKGLKGALPNAHDVSPEQ